MTEGRHYILSPSPYSVRRTWGGVYVPPSLPSSLVPRAVTVIALGVVFHFAVSHHRAVSVVISGIVFHFAVGQDRAVRVIARPQHCMRFISLQDKIGLAVRVVIRHLCLISLYVKLGL